MDQPIKTLESYMDQPIEIIELYMYQPTETVALYMYQSIETQELYMDNPIRLFRIMSIPTTFRLFLVLTSEYIGRRLPVFTLLL